MKRLVIVGNGMAADKVLELIVEQGGGTGGEWEVTVFGDEPRLAYNRILLVDVLTGRKTCEGIQLKTAEWYKTHRIHLKAGVKVTRIDSGRKIVIDSDGNATRYDKLLLAVGARPFLPPVPGIDKERVCVIRSLDDVESVQGMAVKGLRAIVVGGGLLGLEAAKGLLDLGMDVTVLHLTGRVMDQQLDEMGASLLKKEIEKLGIKIRLEAVLDEICGSTAVDSVRLKGGETLPADMVVVCAGIVPDLTLARESGIRTNRGVVVDDELRTSEPDIFAIGDVAEHRGKCYGLVAPLNEQAWVVLSNMRRTPEEPPVHYGGTPCMTKLKVSGIAVTSAGKFDGGEDQEQIVMLDTSRGIYKKFVFHEDRLCGAILVGDFSTGATALGLIESGLSAASFRESLLAENGTGIPVKLTDQEYVCNCHGVTRETIVEVVRTKGLRSRQEVATHTKASTGCGGCAQDVTDLVAQYALSPSSPLSSPSPAPSPEVAEPVLMRTLLSEYPPAYPKGLEIDRIKKEGLGLDFDAIFEKDVQALSEDDFYRLKTYGICSQKHPGFFMLRIRIPGGKITSDQAKAISDLSRQYAGGWVHVSTRQNFELHWVKLQNVRAIWERLTEVGLSTRSSCGHTMRNVMACPHGAVSPGAVMDVEPIARAISDFFVRRSDYINPALPNRLNILFSACPDCDPDVVINDLGFRAVKREGTSDQGPSIGFEMWVGGSLGAHPSLGFKLKDWLSIRDVLPACQAVFEIYMKHGLRNKAKSRLKWLLEQWGRERFSLLFEQVFHGKRSLPENAEIPWETLERSGMMGREEATVSTKLAWFRESPGDGCYSQKQSGKVRIPVHLPLGEIRSSQLASLAELAYQYGESSLHLTKEQNVEIQGVVGRHAAKLLRVLSRMKLFPVVESKNRNIVACPGTEFCVLAVTDSQGVAHSLFQEMKFASTEAARLFEGIQISVSGCPNSCAKHQVADIGLAGGMTMVNGERRYSYSLFLGGSMKGGVRLGEVVLKGITEEVVGPVVQDVVECVASHREGEEEFHRVMSRVGLQKISQQLEERIKSRRPRVWEKILMECLAGVEESGVLPG
ncbi:MAG: FAD-dependent oxidoreductase [Leptospirales bacterium]